MRTMSEIDWLDKDDKPIVPERDTFYDNYEESNLLGSFIDLVFVVGLGTIAAATIVMAVMILTGR
jgi:hypothetical protein